MAASHVAILRSSNRIAQQLREEKEKEELSQQNQPENPNELSNQMSVISLSSSDGDDLSHDSATNRRRAHQQHDKNRKYHREARTRPMVTSLGQLRTVADIDNCLDPDLRQLAVLERLEQKWFDISDNLDNVMSHLNECSGQVTDASICCLEALNESVRFTCDKADEQVNALNNLMAKCDELGTKISVASTFCDEIKTLRKSIDTLENLYKSRPQKPVSQ